MFILKVAIARLRLIALSFVCSLGIYIRNMWQFSISDARARTRALFARYNFASEAGISGMDTLFTVFFAIILLIALVTYLWNTGLPALVGATNNTTALVAAGATAEQLTWVALFGGLLFLVIMFAVMRFAFGMFGGGGGGGRAGKAVRRSRRRKK